MPRPVAAAESKEPAQPSHVTGVTITREGLVTIEISRPEKKIDSKPGKLLTISRDGMVKGWMEIDKCNATTCTGQFEAACPLCLPAPGDDASPSAGAFLLPSIQSPEKGEKIPTSGQLTEKDTAIISDAFNEFLERENRAIIPAGPQESGFACPTGNASDIDAEIETELFPAPGDVLAITGWEEQPRFCVTVNNSNRIDYDAWNDLSVEGKTVAQIERELGGGSFGPSSKLDITLLPGERAQGTCEMHITGEVKKTGRIFFGAAPTVGRALEEAGNNEPFYTLVHVSHAGSENGDIKIEQKNCAPETAAKGAGADYCDEIKTTCGDILFVSKSKETASEFIEEVLPFMAGLAVK